MGTLFRPENYKMWKWIGYITAVLPLVGVLYGGLRIASDLQTSLEQSIQTSADAHARIDSIAQSQKDINKQLLDLQSISAEVNGIVGSLERQKNDSVTRGQMDTLRDQLSALKESISAEVNGIVESLERQKNDSVTRGQLDILRDQLYALRDTLEQMGNMSNKVSDIYSRLDKIEREVNNTQIDDDKRIHNVLKDIEEIFRRLDRANID
jgi:polyhydroxyalkanoate synthesis regulator phasin